MLPLLLSVLLAALVLKLVAIVAFTRWAMRWGATPAELSAPLPGDDYFTGDSSASVAMTRAITIAASPDTVWPWLAQLGRGAGWYSYDRLDNGGKMSATHIVSWVPSPRPGDASPIGYLREVKTGRQLTWWAPGVRFCGAVARLAVDLHLAADEQGSRLVIRNSADATGALARPALWIFQFIDSVMARRQLLGIRERVEDHGARTSAPELPETGERDQYQLYEVIYASGERAGTLGRENAAHWHRVAADL